MTSPYMPMARQEVGLELDPQVNALKRQLAMLAQQKAAQEGAIQQQGQLTQGALEKLYSQLAGTQSAIQQQQSANYGAVERSNSANYDALSQFLGQNAQAAVGNTSNELQRLGIQEVAPEALREIQRDAANLQGMTAVERTNSQSNNENNRLSFEALLSGMRANTDAEKAQQIAGNRRQTDRSLSELRSEFGQNNYELSGKLGDLEAQRSGLIAQKIRDLTSSEPTYEDELDVALKKARLDQLLNPNSTAAKSGKTPSGRDAAMSYLSEVGGRSKGSELQNIFRTLESGNAGHTERYAFSLSDLDISDHIRRKVESRGWGGPEQNALRQAMAIYFGKA